MAAKKRKKRKLSAAHLKALQAGLARWKRGAGKSKTVRKKRTNKRTARKRRTTVAVTVRNPRKHSARRWWMFDTGRGCYVGSGTHDQAKKRAQAFANRTGNAGHLVGPFASKDAAKAACG